MQLKRLLLLLLLLVVVLLLLQLQVEPTGIKVATLVVLLVLVLASMVMVLPNVMPAAVPQGRFWQRCAVPWVKGRRRQLKLLQQLVSSLRHRGLAWGAAAARVLQLQMEVEPLLVGKLPAGLFLGLPPLP